MVAVLIAFVVSNSVQVGDRWVIERTLRFVQEAEKVEVKRVERLSYQVVQAGTELTAISIDTRSVSPPSDVPVKRVFTFKPNGFLLSREDESDENAGRLNRVEWTATEARQGISWSRDWPASGALLEAKVSVRPKNRTLEDTTMAVTYKEGAVARCVATVKVLNRVRIVKELAATISGALAPGATKPGDLFISDKLKELHLVDGR